MAKLNFNVRGFMYQSGIDCLRDSFAAAAKGIQDQIREESEAWDSQSGDYAEEPQCAEDGSTLFDPGDIYSYKMEVLQEAYAELRKAFAITIYHYWERRLRVYANLPNGNHKKLTAASESLGYAIPPEFARVHRLANALKHNNAECLNKLHLVWPEVSGVLFKAEGNRDWYSGIELDDDAVYHLLDLTKLAGPSVKKLESEPKSLATTPCS
ncbi:hypothetical protein [Rhizobium terrae]|uniref:hypothetical protein n=1 Tax=Rhizobium terrae TaxID=2171756 RepID=UPI000E3E35A1|nr:hypothetical protein [Rhizobium terrae]